MTSLYSSEVSRARPTRCTCVCASARTLLAESGRASRSALGPHTGKEVIKYYHKLISEGLIPADWATKALDAYDSDQTSDGKTAKTAKTGVSFGWSQDASFGTLKDQYIPIPVPSAPGVSPDKTVWDGSSSEFDGNKLSITGLI